MIFIALFLFLLTLSYGNFQRISTAPRRPKPGHSASVLCRVADIEFLAKENNSEIIAIFHI